MAHAPDASAGLDIDALRREFPILDREVSPGRPLVYLDNAATTHKPRRVIEATTRFYEELNSNVHRGVHTLSQRATDAYEGARATLAGFLNAPSSDEVIFVRGATEAINLVASSLERWQLAEGDEIIVSELEHHSNIVPWQMACERAGARVVKWPIDDRGQLDLGQLGELLNERTKLVAVNHVSNALGTVNPIEEVVSLAHAAGALVLIDGAQGTPHEKVDVQAIGCDFYAVSGHKMYGPTGIGLLWGRRELLDGMPPYQGGGDMILTVSFDGSTYNKVPARFEAGTPNICGAIGLGEAARFLQDLGIENVARHEAELLAHGEAVLGGIEGLRRIGTAERRAGVLSFVLPGVHAHDIGTIVDQDGVAIRAGHHCAQPVMERFGVAATVRASLGVYNTKAELDALGVALGRVMELFG